MSEVLRQLRRPHVLDHSDGCDGIEPAVQVPVVVLDDADPFRDARVYRPFPRLVCLLATDSHTGRFDSVMARSVDDEAAPATADIEESVSRPQLQLAADEVELAPLGD